MHFSNNLFEMISRSNSGGRGGGGQDEVHESTRAQSSAKTEAGFKARGEREKEPFWSSQVSSGSNKADLATAPFN